MDVVLHFAGDPPALPLLPGGRLARTLGFGPDQHPAASVMASPTPETLDRLSADVAAGRLTVPITATYALDDAANAFAAHAAGALGKLAISVS